MGLFKMGHFKCPLSHVLNFNCWIKLIYEKITLIYCVENAFNPTSEVQNIENRVFQNAPFVIGHFPNGDYSCLWAEVAKMSHGKFSYLLIVCPWYARTLATFHMIRIAPPVILQLLVCFFIGHFSESNLSILQPRLINFSETKKIL